MRNYSEEYKRNLPHIQPKDGVFFITYRLKGSLPKKILEEYLLEYERLSLDSKTKKNASLLFIEMADKYLDSSKRIDYLKNPSIAKIVKDSLHFFDSKYFKLIAYCIMSNHVHVIVDQNGFEDIALSEVFGRIKSFSANTCNNFLGKTGSFWSSEIYDHLLQNRNDLDYYIKYTLQNPVAAGIVDKWDKWPNSYLNSDYAEENNIY